MSSLSLQAQTFTLTIKVEKVPSAKGKLMVGIYNKADGFRDTKKTFKNLVIPAQTGTMTVTIPQLPAGNYAIAVFHDANENGILDTNFLGIPTEAYGFSNNASKPFGPPDFEDCKVVVQGSKEISIRLK